MDERNSGGGGPVGTKETRFRRKAEVVGCMGDARDNGGGERMD